MVRLVEAWSQHVHRGFTSPNRIRTEQPTLPTSGTLGLRVVMRRMSAEEASMRRLSSDIVAQHEACIKNVHPSDILKCNRDSSSA